MYTASNEKTGSDILPQLASYNVVRILHETERVLVCRAVTKKDKMPVVLKMLKRSRQQQRDVERFRNAFKIGSLINDSVIKTLALEQDPQGLILAFADNQSLSLDEYYSETMDLKKFLTLAVKIADAVARLHRQGVVHCDLKPQNILIHPQTGEVKLMDLELAVYLPREQQIMPNPWLMEGSLPYMSPEQTGKTNHAIDTRSDLYSLGITFYQMWLGRLPFQAEDPLGWIYNHLTATPASLFNIKPQTPVVVSDIINKLLEKDPNSRYQSAVGLKKDLEKCLDLLIAEDTIPTFVVGQNDISDRFQIPHKLYGRDKEVRRLLETFDHFVHAGKSELILVSGYSGVGKTSLIRELYKPLVKKRGFFLSGKFDQFKKGIPYSTLSQAFQSFVLELLAEPEEQINQWRKKIKNALGNNAQLMIDLIPELEFLIGPQKKTSEASLAEAENKFRMVIRQFLSVFANEQHPVVLVLDDLQWADQASLKFIHDILTSNDLRYLFLIGAYRDNEVNPSHPLTLAIASLKQEKALISELILNSLAYEDLAKLISDTLHRSIKDIEPLAHLIYSKTAGNPFFFIQLLIALHQEQSIYFDAATQSWKWKLDEIREKKHAENVVELILGRLRKLPKSVQDTLALAACVGNVFSRATLIMISNSSEEQIRENLWVGVNEGLILQTQSDYKFLHDRVQQAAISLLSEDQRQQTHLRIGQQLLNHTAKDKLADFIFDITNQLNQGMGLIHDRNEREQLAELNLKAAQKARQAAAYDPAVTYLVAGMSLLDEDCWENNYNLSFSLYIERTQCEYLNKNFEQAEKYFLACSKRGRNKSELAAVYGIGIQLYSNKAEVPRALDLARSYIRSFAIDLPETPTMDDVTREVHKILKFIEKRPIESLNKLPEMTDVEKKALLSIVIVSLPAAYITNDKLWALFTCLSVVLCLENGNSEYSALAFSTFSMVLGAFFQMYKEGYRFGQLAIEIAHRYPNEASNAAVYTTVGTMITHWVKPFKDGSPYIRKGYQIGVETGNQTWACYACNLLISSLLSEGLPLSEVQKESESSFDFASRAKFQTQINGILTNQLFIQWMRGQGTIDEIQHEANLLAIHWPIEVCWFYVRKLQAKFIMGDYNQALLAAEKAAPLLWTSPSFMQVADYSFFHALLLAQLGRRSDIQKHIQELEIWEKNSPDNFTDKHNLVLAEVARLDGQSLEAEYFYEKAIQASKQSGFNHTEALGCELAARFYNDRGFAVTGEAYLQEARASYTRWEATAKVKNLESKYHLKRSKPIVGTSEVDTFMARVPDLDFLSIIKASQTISGKIVASDLSRTLLNVIMEHAAAQKGCLILSEDNQLMISAMSSSDQSVIHVDLLSKPIIDAGQLLPVAIVQYVARTGTRVILADATQNAEPFSNNEYLNTYKPRSVLCLPIFRQLKAVGYLYLENTSVSGVFTQDRLAVLELLASQAAISIENARLLSYELTARQAAEKEKQRAAFFAEAGKLLSESLEYEQVLERLALLVTRHMADWCEFDMIEEGQIHRRVGNHINSQKLFLLKELANRYPPTWNSPHPSMQVLQMKKSLLISEVKTEHIEKYTVDAEHERIIRALGTKTAMCVLLQTPRRLLGVMTIASEKENIRYDQNDLELAVELAKRASIAIDNALLYREARNAVQLRDDFISIASHELRTPLTPMKMQMSILKRHLKEAATDPGKMNTLSQVVEGADRQVERLSILVEDMLDVSRMTAGPIILDIQSCDLAELTKNIVQGFQNDFLKHNTRVHLIIPNAVIGFWDAKRLEQVVVNFVTNAIKYGRGQDIEVSVKKTKDKAVLAVKDYGIGISKSDQKKLFGRFTRLVSVKNYGGLGLGLYIAHQIVEAHHGEIQVDSELGKGATFSMVLPLDSRH